MGFKQNRGGNKVFLSPSHGKLVTRCEEGAENAVSRELTKGKNKGDIIWEQHFPGYEGHITSVYIEENEEWGDKLVIELEDKSAKKNDPYRNVTLTVSLDSSYAMRFIRRVQNIDLDDAVLFDPYELKHQSKADKMVTGWNLYQRDEQKPIAQTLEDSEIPEWKELIVNKKKTYDKTECMDFLTAHLKEWIEEHDLGKKRQARHVEEDDEEEEEAPKKSFGQPKSSSKGKPADIDDDEVEF